MAPFHQINKSTGHGYGYRQCKENTVGVQVFQVGRDGPAVDTAHCMGRVTLVCLREGMAGVCHCRRPPVSHAELFIPNRSLEFGLIVVGCPGRLVVFCRRSGLCQEKNDWQDDGKRLQAAGERVAKRKLKNKCCNDRFGFGACKAANTPCLCCKYAEFVLQIRRVCVVNTPCLSCCRMRIVCWLITG